MLIVIDGIDGAGKTTQTEILVKRLKIAGQPVVTFDYPQYDLFFGQLVRRFLDGDFGNIKQVDPHLAALLYALNRFETRDKLQRWLKARKIVILARYTTANLIHQTCKLPASKRAQFIRWIEKLEYDILDLPKPDVVLYLNLPPKLAYGLISKRGRRKDIHEAEIKHLSAAHKQGLALARQNRGWQIVPCSAKGKILTREQIANKIWTIVKSHL